MHTYIFLVQGLLAQVSTGCGSWGSALSSSLCPRIGISLAPMEAQVGPDVDPAPTPSTRTMLRKLQRQNMRRCTVAALTFAQARSHRKGKLPSVLWSHQLVDFRQTMYSTHVRTCGKALMIIHCWSLGCPTLQPTVSMGLIHIIWESGNLYRFQLLWEIASTNGSHE